MDTDERRVDYMPLPTIEAAERNPKRHAASAIRASIGRFGVAELPLIDERTGRLVAGHGRLDDLAARHRTGEPAPAGVKVDSNGTWLIPVIRGWSSRSDADAEAYLVTSNKLPSKGGWDDEELADLLGGLRDTDPDLFAVTGFTDTELDALLAGPTVLPDVLPPGDSGGGYAGAARGTALGDMWALGRHRLLCGDATNPDHLDRLIDSVDGESTAVHTIAPRGDDGPGLAGDVYRYLTSRLPDALHVWWGAHHYAAAAGLPDSRCWLVALVKGGRTDDDADLAWTNHDGPVQVYTGRTAKGEHDNPARTDRLAIWALDTVDQHGHHQYLLDPFAAAGSTLMAAHDTNRTCAALDVSPTTVDALCLRFQRETGIKPERIHDDGTREVVDFT